MEDKKSDLQNIIKLAEIFVFSAVLVLVFLFTAYRVDVIYDNIWTKILMAVEFLVLMGYWMSKIEKTK